MEKQRIKSTDRLFKRFLILTCVLLSCTNSLFAQVFNSRVASTLLIEPVENQNLYIKSDVKFEVLLPYASSTSIQIKNPEFPENVNFKTLRKTEYFDNGGGTKLEIWLSFDKKDYYRIPPISVLYKNRTYLIKFAPVEIDNNPEIMNPRMVIVFSNGETLYSDEGDLSKPVISAVTGEKLSFTVNLQYGLQLLQFDYELPKDSIFTEKQRYEITSFKLRDAKYSHELLPIADFEWTALCEGVMEMPKITLVATNYKGYKSEVRFPEYKIEFVKGLDSLKTVGNRESAIFDSAFDFSPLEETAGKELLVTDEICSTIAKLRSRERNSTFDYFKNKKSRIETEDFFLFDSSKNEFPVVLVFFFLCLTVLFIILLIVFIKRKNSYMVILYSVLMILGIGVTVVCSAKSSRLYGMCLGGTLQSVPEETAASKSEISGGSRVYVSEKSGDWYYIEFGETAGWIKSDRVVLIR